MLTFLPIEQIDEMDKWEGSQLNQAKEILAFELTKLVHDDAGGREGPGKCKSALYRRECGGNAYRRADGRRP